VITGALLVLRIVEHHFDLGFEIGDGFFHDGVTLMDECLFGGGLEVGEGEVLCFELF
jgi:hypothetical protein